MSPLCCTNPSNPSSDAQREQRVRFLFSLPSLIDRSCTETCLQAAPKKAALLHRALNNGTGCGVLAKEDNSTTALAGDISLPMSLIKSLRGVCMFSHLIV